MKALQGTTRLAFLGYFSSHIVFTLVCDLQAILRPYLYPPILVNLVKGYASLGDPHMSEPFDLWFQSLVVCELIFQLPYFFVACYYLWGEPSATGVYKYPKWFQMLSIVYGAHVATTLVPLFPTIWAQQSIHVPMEQRLLIEFLYLPYFIFPVLLAWLAAADAVEEDKATSTNGTTMNGHSNGKRNTEKSSSESMVGSLLFYFCGIFLLVCAYIIVMNTHMRGGGGTVDHGRSQQNQSAEL